ncbi:hypothetical protein RQP46_002373 [Phenoliferia psychrophenolica]
MMINPRHALMRSRRVSLPANLVQTNYHSIVGGGAVGASVAAKNRMSVASVSSFESLPEEDSNNAVPAVPDSSPKAEEVSSRPRPSLSRRSASPGPPSARLSGVGHQRHSLPPAAYNGAYQSFVVPQTLTAGRMSPLGRSQSWQKEEKGGKPSKEEKIRRGERRWRIAHELRETERSYVAVLSEIDKEYYQPLLEALPLSDLAARRAQRSSSQPTSPQLNPTTTTTTPILSRKEIGEIFSNFTDVLNLSHVILATLDDAIPDRPSSPVPFAAPFASSGKLGNHTPELSSSTETVDSTGPGTPRETPSEPDERSSASASTSSEKERRPHPPPMRLGRSLLPILPFLKSYSLFIANFSGALARLSSLELASIEAPDNDDSGPVRWKKFCGEKKRRGVSKGLGLGGLLLNVVQRVPRYRYLLEDLLRYTERDHPDWKDLNSAFDIVDKVANHLESEISSHTSDLEILDLQRAFISLDAPLLAPSRRLLKSGLLRKLDRRGNDQVRTFFLFNDILIHASGGEISSSWRTPEPSERPRTHRRMSHGGSAASSMGSNGTTAAQYRFHRRFELEDVTVIGLEDSSDATRKFGFEIISPEKSFALYADSLETKLEWISAIREANSNLLRDRRTLHRATSPPPQRNRRISLPSPPPSSPQLNLMPFTRQKLSLPPTLDLIPSTPTESPPALVSSPGLILGGIGTDYAFPRTGDQEKTDRRWSASSTPADDVVLECRVIENYSAPVWVPDSKAERCMKCVEPFGVWRRRHHCRLCGSVVCWACSTKTFVIPSADDAALDRLARACDSCYETVFGSSPDPSLHQHPSLQTTTPMLGPHSSGSHFFAGAPFSPATPGEYPDTPGIDRQLQEQREKGGAAIASLASILGR